jgi:E3 ubiquitin-protein ligase listerin
VMDELLLAACSRIVAERIENISMDKMTVPHMERFTEIVSKLVICSTEQESDGKLAVVDKLIGKLLARCAANELFMDNLSLTIELMHGGIVLRDAENVPDREYLDALDTYLKHQIFNLEVIIKLTCNIKKSERREMGRDATEDMEPGDEIEFAELQAQAQEEEATEDYCDMDENLLREWSEAIFVEFLDVCYAAAVLDVQLMNVKELHADLETWIIFMQERLEVLMRNLPETILTPLREKLFAAANAKGGLWAKCLMNLLHSKTYSSENGAVLLYEDSVTHANQDETIVSYVNILQAFSEKMEKKSLPITTNLFENYSNLLVKVSASRSLIRNHLNVGDFNEMGDRKIVGNALIVMNEILTRQKAEPFLLYNKDVSLEDPQSVLLATEVANLLTDVLSHFPDEVDVKRWDFIRIALSSWVLSVSKSSERFGENKVKVFVSAIFRLNATLFKFIQSEKVKSSTELLKNIIDEWEKVFAKEVNLVLIKSFIHIVNSLGEYKRVGKGKSWQAR